MSYGQPPSDPNQPQQPQQSPYGEQPQQPQNPYGQPPQQYGQPPYQQPYPQQYQQNPYGQQLYGAYSDKDWTTALILSILLGGLGVDRFYLGYTGLGVINLLSVGGCGIWAIVDIIMIATNKLPDAQGRPLKQG
jgi:hypothetical protein